MRERDTWHRPVSKELRPVWADLSPEQAGIRPALLCQVELALRLLERLAPSEPAGSAYILLGGYPFALAAGLVNGEEDEMALAAARHLLWTLRRNRSWQLALEAYRTLPERLRAYHAPDDKSPACALRPTVAPDRLETYDAALAGLPPFARKDLPLAPPGRSTFTERRRLTSVTFPEELRPDPATGHDLATGRPGNGARITLKRQELTEVARWMDAEETRLDAPPGNWEARLADLRFALRDTDGHTFSERDELTLDGLLHLAGMVGAGKSTMMTLVAVWAAKRGLRTTLVVGDVAEQLRITKVLRVFEGVPTTPVLGPTTRETHVQRLHRRLAARGRDNLLDHDDEGFDDLSTVCVVDALRGTEAAQPLRYADAPCVSLHPEKKAEEPSADVLRPYSPGASPEIPALPDAVAGPPHGCPLWGVCPRHRAARDLVDGLVWVANPASLVQSSVPSHLNPERLRHLELACLMSDIVIVDEVDSVQMKLDEIFAPSATLVTPDLESWLDQLHRHKISELARRGRLPLTDQEIERWNSALTTVSAATDRLYRLLISDEELRAWAEVEYFSPWTLQEKLLADWFDQRDAETESVDDEQELFETDEDAAEEAEDPRRTGLTAFLDNFRDDPLGGRGRQGTLTDAIVDVAKDLLNALSAQDVRPRVQDLLDTLAEGTPAPVDDQNWREVTGRRLEFMLLLAVLDHRLDRLTFLWPQVEAALRLDSTGNELGRRPPLDYAPIVPEAPMGNVLGFQFLPNDKERDEDGRYSGTLRFFRCAGVGRELLLSLHRIGTEPGRPGPHVVLMSGTSWAGASTRAHVLAPVGAVLKPSDESLEAVGRTKFATRFFYTDDGKPINLSGTDPKVRPAVVRTLIGKLAGPGRGGTASPLEQELALVEDESRRRAILLVGSYREAGTVVEAMHAMDRWKGKVRLLAADDADLDLSVARTTGEESAGTLRRGDLAAFADDQTAEILVAPLMAVERGHNILNSERNAAFGTAFFLARPHPRPDDLSLAVFAINDWATRFVRDEIRDDHREGPATFSELVAKAKTLHQAGLDFRREARQEWRRLLSRRYIHSRLPDWEQKAFAWDQLVTIWQVIGRLVRGGVPARVVFVDARFAPRMAKAMAPGTSVKSPVPDPDGLLAALHDILRAPSDPELARLLYEPLFNALSELEYHT